MTFDPSRRKMLGAAISVGAGAALGARPSAAAERTAAEPFGYCLNTSTIRGQELTLAAEIDIAAQAGYQAIEPWIGELDKHERSGGSLRDLGKRIRDQGLTVESAIGFCEWIVDDPQRRAKGLEEARRSMDMVAQIGGRRIAAPPVGATEGERLDLIEVAARYRALLEVGQKLGVVPQVEVWGFSKNLGRLGEIALVAIESGHPQACLLPDVYHLYKGGSDLSALRLLSGSALHVFHVNDYPAAPPRDEITDAARIYPGDGVAPLAMMLRTLRDVGFCGYLSLELFNADYWRLDALTVARAGLEKTKAVVRQSLG